VKVRQGFVSNSSTTSFCIYGTDVPQDILDALNEEEGLYAFLEQEPDLSIEYGDPNGWPDREIFVGCSLTRMEDDETFGEFKARVAAAIKRLFGDDLSPGIIEVGYYNG